MPQGLSPLDLPPSDCRAAGGGHGHSRLLAVPRPDAAVSALCAGPPQCALQPCRADTARRRLCRTQRGNGRKPDLRADIRNRLAVRKPCRSDRDAGPDGDRRVGRYQTPARNPAVDHANTGDRPDGHRHARHDPPAARHRAFRGRTGAGGAGFAVVCQSGQFHGWH